MRLSVSPLGDLEGLFRPTERRRLKLVALVLMSVDHRRFGEEGLGLDMIAVNKARHFLL